MSSARGPSHQRRPRLVAEAKAPSKATRSAASNQPLGAPESTTARATRASRAVVSRTRSRRLIGSRESSVAPINLAAIADGSTIESSPRSQKEMYMALSPKDAKIAEMNRFLDDLERAARVSPAALDQAFNSPPAGLSVHEIDTKKKFLTREPRPPQDPWLQPGRYGWAISPGLRGHERALRERHEPEAHPGRRPHSKYPLVPKGG